MPEAITAADTNSAVHELLHQLGVDRGGAVLFHSGFRRFSQRGFRAEAFLDSILDYMDDGIVAFPAMSWRICTVDNPAFFELETPSNVGVLSEMFRTQHAHCRSLHPTHSVAALGPGAEHLTSDHHLNPSPCSDLSPWGRLGKIDARIVLLDVDMDSCTLIHHLEETFAPRIYLKDELETYSCTSRLGQQFSVPIHRHRKLYRNFWKFRDMLTAKDQLETVRSEDAVAFGFAATDLIECGTEAFDRDKNASLAKSGERSKLM